MRYHLDKPGKTQLSPAALITTNEGYYANEAAREGPAK